MDNKEKEKKLVSFLSIGFLSYFIDKYTDKDLHTYINEVTFDKLIKLFDEFIQKISEQYFKLFTNKSYEYNQAIKKQIDKELLDETLKYTLDLKKSEIKSLGLMLLD